MRRRWLGVVSLLAAFALVAAACGDDDTGGSTTQATTTETTTAATTTTTEGTTATTTAATTTAATTAAEEVQFDFGVTPAPCGDAVNEGNGCIYLGVLSDLSDGPFVALAVPITRAQEDFWDKVNADGGLDGFDVFITAENTFDTHYDPGLTVEGYESMKDDVLMIAQTLGTPQTQAVLPRYIEDDIVSGIASWSETWAHKDEGHVLEAGAPYCIDAINNVSHAVGILGSDITWAVVAFPGDYGGEYAIGASIAASELGLGDPVANITQLPLSVGGETDSTAAELIAAAPDLIVIVTGPNEMAEIVGKVFGGGHQAFKVAAAAPTWNVGLLGVTDLVPLLQAVYYVSGPFGGWDTDSQGHADMRASALANGQDPNNAYLQGWAWSYPTKALLERGLADKNIMREHLVEVAQTLEVDYDGIMPNRSHAGAPDDNVERSSVVSGVDPEASDGLVPLTDVFISETAASLDFSNPCLDV